MIDESKKKTLKLSSGKTVTLRDSVDIEKLINNLDLCLSHGPPSLTKKCDICGGALSTQKPPRVFPEGFVRRSLSAMDSTIRRLENLQRIIAQTFGNGSREVRAIRGCIFDIQVEYINLQTDYEKSKK